MHKKRVRHHVNPLADRTEHAFAGFGNARPIVMDIGADRGEFVAQLAEQWGATKNFIVCEIRKPMARKLVERFRGYDNVRVFDGDATRNVRALLQPSLDAGVTVEEIYINFPDPWFKERHKKRRVLTERFVQDVRMWIPPQTRWIFQTDQQHLFAETVEMLRANGIVPTFFDTPPHGATTKWENAKIADGKKIYRCMFTLSPGAAHGGAV